MDSRTFELDILTPVHVGSHEGSFTTYDYAIAGGSLYVIHHGRLAEFLASRGKAEEFARAVERQGNRFDVGEFLQRLRVSEEELLNLSRYRIAADERAGIRQLQPQIRDASGKDYLPGSSIKGALRTACAYAFLKALKRERPEEFESLIGRLAGKLRNASRGSRQRGREKNLFEEQERRLFQYFDLPRFLERDGKPRHGPNTDVLRCLHVTDAYPLESRVEAVNARVLDKGPDGRLTEESPLYIEAIASGTYRLEMSWDAWLAEEFLKNNRGRVESGLLVYPRGLEDILEACREFVEDQIAWEQAFFRSCLDGDRLAKSVEELKGRANLRLGWGSGLVGASISMLLPEDLKDEIRRALRLRYDKRVRDFPKSRRVAYKGRVPMALMGFCRLREVS